MLRYSLMVISVLWAGCFYPADRGKALEGYVESLRADNAALRAELDEAKKKLAEALPRFD